VVDGWKTAAPFFIGKQPVEGGSPRVARRIIKENFMDAFDQLDQQPNKAPVTTASAPSLPPATSVSTSSPVSPTTTGDAFDQLEAQEKAQADTKVAADQQRQQIAKHGVLHRAWDWVNTPVFDNILPKDIKTEDIIKAAAFEQMYHEAYIPGMNDFSTKAQAHLGENPTKHAIRTFINGAANDTANLAAGFTSPVGIATTVAGVGPEAKAGSAAAKAIKGVGVLAGTAFGLQGAHDIYEAGTENTPEAWQQRLQGAAQVAGGAAAAGEGLNAARTKVQENIADRVRPVTKTVAGQEIPVRPDTKAGQFAAKVVAPEVLTRAAEKTAGAVQSAVGEVAKGATGSEAETSVKGEDRFGLRGHATDLIENQARPVFKALDELSDGAFSEAQKAEKTARRVGDFDKLNEAVNKQDELTEQFRDELNARGLDPDEAWGNYRKGIALQKIASQFDTATAAKDTGLGYQVKGDKLANAIDRIRRTAPEKNLFTKAGFTDSHVDALAELADTLRNEQAIPKFNSFSRFAAKALAGAIGFGHSGVFGLAEALTGESAAESLIRKGATSLLGQAMMSEPATRELTDAMKTGDTDKGVTAVQNLAQANPAWWGGLKTTLSRLWKDETGSVGAPGTVGGTPNETELAPTFFSKAEQVANQKVNTGSGDAVLATLRNNGVKDSEIQWLGLDDFLKGKPKVSKDDLQQYINEHKIALNETNLGGNDWKNVRDLNVQRNKVYAENNRLWADHLRYADGSTDLFNAMKEGRDIEPVIATMPAEAREPARRFVETDQQVRDLDKQIAEAEKNVKPSRYESYTLPGDKDNYTEKLLTLPSDNSAVRQAYENAENERNTYISTGSLVPGDVELRFQDAQTAMRKAANANASKTFQSSHFDEPNVLAHARYDDRTSLDGKKTLLLEELQSDWHQKGKKVGYQNPAPTKLPDGIFVVPESGQFQVVNREGNPLLSRLFGSEQEAKTAALSHYGEGAGNPGVPDAPFKSDWHELVVKRMLRHAAENGYNRLAWTTGDQQAARYDLSKHIGRVTYDPTDNTLQAFDPNGKNVLIETVEPKASAISEYIGKEPAQKLMEKVAAYKPAGEGEDEPDIPELKGLDLKVGGDWAKALYDRAIPNFLNKYAKKWGAKVGSTELDTTPSGSLRYEIVDPKGNVQDAFRNRAGADEAVTGYNEAHRGRGKWTVRDAGTTEKVHSIDITPAMKKSVLHEGQPIAENQPILDWRQAVTGQAA
jgi:hypothetical protein